MIKRYYCFCDESGVTKDEFLVISGVVIPESDLSYVNDAVNEYRRRSNMHAELKWEKITNQKESEYRSLIDLFFEMNRSDRIHFHCLAVPYRRFDHQIVNHGDRSASLHKMQYQLMLRRFCCLYGAMGAQLDIYVDGSSSPLSAPDVVRMLNRDCAKRFRMTHYPVQRTESLDSADSNLLQVNDVILGAVSAVRNKRNMNPEGRPAKKNLANYVLRMSGLGTYERNTPPYRQRRFTVWNFDSPLLRQQP